MKNHFNNKLQRNLNLRTKRFFFKHGLINVVFAYERVLLFQNEEVFLLRLTLSTVSPFQILHCLTLEIKKKLCLGTTVKTA